MPLPSFESDAIILGAGAAGLMCAIEAGKRSRSVIVLERNARIGEKIRISGGGRCNFTNLNADATNYISENPHFCKSAMARFTTGDFIAMVEGHGIQYHEKKLGQLFCDESSEKIIHMLEAECEKTRIDIRTGCNVKSINKGESFILETDDAVFRSNSLVVATGGLSIPQLGATNAGYEIARLFGHDVTPLVPGLVPLKFDDRDLSLFKTLSGVSLEAIVRSGKTEFRENILFTHRGISGPAVLQISSYWREGETLHINLLPDTDPEEMFADAQSQSDRLDTILGTKLPKRFAEIWCDFHDARRPFNKFTKQELTELASALRDWQVVPRTSEGFGKAEVTVGGVRTDELSSKTMESKLTPGLFFVGEVVDVTGWLGGYNFQWAWASGWVAGQYC